MKGQAPAYWVNAGQLVRGLFDEGSDEQTLLQLAACNVVELHATSKTWNNLLWLVMNSQGKGDSSISGQQLGELRASLPISFH
jgi:hypothetical protein